MPIMSLQNHASYKYDALPLPSDPVISSFETKDVRFPTSLDKTGSDAMNAAGDYSAAYCILYTGNQAGAGASSPLEGHGMTFTIGRGNDLVCHAIPYFASMLVGKSLSSLVGDFGATWRRLNSDSQIRWVGPEKGVVHLALGAVVNAIWDLWGKVLDKPVWQVVCEMSSEEVVRCVDFRYIEDAITPTEALEMLKNNKVGKDERLQNVANSKAVPAYTTSAGWLGYSLEKMKALLQEAKDAGYEHFKLKVGGDLQRDIERLRAAREVIGPKADLMVDANQVWSVPQAVDWMKQLAEFRPTFIEEPTSPDDVVGHAAVRKALKPHGIGVATGEMCQNRVMFKQLLQLDAIDVVQVDACRLGGLNEVLAVLLLAAKFNVPIVPHSGGVGLPEYTQHVSTIDYAVVSGKLSMLEFVDSLHEHFEHSAQVVAGYYVTPSEAGYSVQMKADSMARYEFPGAEGVSWWRTEEAKQIIDGPRV